MPSLSGFWCLKNLQKIMIYLGTCKHFFKYGWSTTNACWPLTFSVIFQFLNKVLWASISHWLGNISKLPNQCENILKIIFHFWKLPNQCEMLVHRVCASIPHWLGKYLVTLNPKNPLWHYENCPINVNCLQIGYEQAFHIYWEV